MLWVWIRAPSFPCSHAVHLVFFGHYVRVTGWIRYLVLTILGVWTFVLGVLVGVQSLTLLLDFLLNAPLVKRVVGSRVVDRVDALVDSMDPGEVEVTSTRTERIWLGTIFGFMCLIFAVVMAELMIATHEVVHLDNGWGFGQFAALILLITPVAALVTALYKRFFKKDVKISEQLADTPDAESDHRSNVHDSEHYKLVPVNSDSDIEDAYEGAVSST